MTESTPQQRQCLEKGVCHNPSVSSLYTREPYVSILPAQTLGFPTDAHS